MEKHKQELKEIAKQLNIKGREKSLNQTLLAYIDLCVSVLFNTFIIFDFFIKIDILGMLWFSK